MVMVLPLLCLFLFAVVDLGRTVYLYAELTTAARAVCRYVEEHPASTPAYAALKEVAITASPSLDSEGLELAVQIDWGEYRNQTYAHRLYRVESGAFVERVAHTQTRLIDVTLTAQGRYLTPVGALVATGSGQGNAMFSYGAHARGVGDTTAGGGVW